MTATDAAASRAIRLFKQVGPAQERRVRRRRAAEHHMIAAAGADMPSVDHELVGAEPRLPRVLVERRGRLDRLPPAARRMDVDLDHAGIGRHLDHVEARIVRRRIAFDVNLRADLARGSFDGRDQRQIVFQPLDRRHEHAKDAVARLDRQRSADVAADVGAVCGRGPALRGPGARVCV